MDAAIIRKTCMAAVLWVVPFIPVQFAIAQTTTNSPARLQSFRSFPIGAVSGV